MSIKKTTVKKYESALAHCLFIIKLNPTVNLKELAKEYQLNANFITALRKLEIIKNQKIDGKTNYVVLRNYSHGLALDVLVYANNLSLNKKQPIAQPQTIIEKHFGDVAEIKPTFFQRLLAIFKF